jgi:hypothetical protein
MNFTTWTVLAILLATPLVGFADGGDGEGLFGLHPDLVKGAFYGLATITSVFAIKVFKGIEANQNMLNDNQRMFNENLLLLFENQQQLALTLENLLVAHDKNHKHTIVMPELKERKVKR